MENALMMTTLRALGEQGGTDDARHAATFAEIVHANAQLIHRIAFAVTHNADDAEDVVQEAFLQLYKTSAWPQITDRRAYLARIAWRIAIRRHTRPTHELSFDLPASSPGAEREAIGRQAESAIHALIDQLPEKLRQPLILTAIEELSSPEVAVILGIPEGTVRRRVHSARELLRKQWDKRSESSRKGARP